MPRYTIVKFKNMTPLHVGNGKENYDFSAVQLHSDTISAALAAIKVQTSGECDVKGFMESFVVSSAFPYWGESYFLPKPQGKIAVRVQGEEEHAYRKSLKKVRYVELSLWQELICGKGLVVESGQLQGEFLAGQLQMSMEPVCASQVVQRVTVPRDSSDDARPFFFEWKFYHPQAGLYCLLQAPEEKEAELVRLFSLLGEAGIGTDRNVGGGRFEVETEQLEIVCPEDADATMLLSLYIPTEEELEQLRLPESRYDLLRRGGYMAGSQEEEFRHLLKKSVYMLNAGSVFPTTALLRGKVVDLRPEWNDAAMHPVYRSGIPMCIPIKQKEV